MTDEELTAIEARAKCALGIVYEVAARGERAWRMSVPPQHDDTDTALCAALADTTALVAHVRRLRAALREALAEHDHSLRRLATLEDWARWARAQEGGPTLLTVEEWAAKRAGTP